MKDAGINYPVFTLKQIWFMFQTLFTLNQKQEGWVTASHQL
jgi:hypothetical protein